MVARPRTTYGASNEMLVLVYVGPVVTVVTCGFVRASPIHASKICVVGASLFVQPPLFTEITRMIADVTPAGTLKNWNVAVGEYGASTRACLKHVACVIRHVTTWPVAAGAESFMVKSIGLPAVVLAGFAVATWAKP